MLQTRTADANIATRISCHTFRATDITTYLQNGGTLELAQQIANHESPRTISLYDRRGDQVSLDEIEKYLDLDHLCTFLVMKEFCSDWLACYDLAPQRARSG